MEVELENRSNYFSIIPSEVRHSDISANAKLIYGDLVGLASKEGYAYVSNNYLAQQLGVDKLTVSRWIKELVDHNFIYSEVSQNYQRKIYLNFGVGSSKGDIQKNQPPLTKKSTPTPMQNNQGGYTKKSTPIDGKIKGDIQKNQYINKDINKKINKDIKTNVQIKDLTHETKNKNINYSKSETKNQELEKEFDQLWFMYPKTVSPNRLVNKKQALKFFVQARKKGITYFEIEDGLRSYSNFIKFDMTEDRFVKSANKWFEEESWKNDYTVNSEMIQKYSMRKQIDQANKSDAVLNIPDPTKPIGS